MKSKVLNRSMFRKAMDPENVGIMDGFKDAMDENLKKALTKGEMPEEDDDALEREDEDEEGESGEMIGRTPRSPEILMNTLRGDMRSTSARRKELADLVGEEAAMETPEEVLTLLQSKLGQGIASVPGQQNAGPAPGGATPPPLPPSGAGAPPSPAGGGLEALSQQMQAAGIAPQGAGAAPQGPGPMDQGAGAAPQGAIPPLNMADGGEVSYARYAAGGEAKKKETLISSLIPDLDPERVRTNAKAYEQLFSSALGQDLERDKKLSKAKFMADIAARSFAFAGNRDIKGNPLTGSFAARTAGAFSDVPSLMVSTAAEQNAMGREARLAALQQALEDENTARTLGAQLLAAQAKRKPTEPKIGYIYGGDGKIAATVNVEKDDDGNVVFTDLATGQVRPLGPDEIPYTKPLPVPEDDSKAVTLVDVNTADVLGAGYERNGRLYFPNGTQAPPNVTFSSFVSPSIPESTKRKENAVNELYAADQILMPALDVAQSITQNPDAATSVNKVAGLLGEAKVELQALGSKFGGDKGEEKINEIFDPNNYAIFDKANITSNNLKKGLLTLAFAFAKTQRGGKISSEFSNKDMEQALAMVGAGSGDPRIILSSVDNVVRGTYQKAFINQMNATNTPWTPETINQNVNDYLLSRGINPTVFNPSIPPTIGSQGPSSETGIAPSSNVIYGDGFSLEPEND